MEINVSVGSGRNTPSPCPSTAGKCLGNFLHHLFFFLRRFSITCDLKRKKNNQRLCFSLSLIISETNKRERERNLAITTYLPRLLEFGQIFERTKTYTASPFVYMGPADGSLNVLGNGPPTPPLASINTSRLGQNAGLGEVLVGSFPETKLIRVIGVTDVTYSCTF